jgi:ABC-type branched-subunit amino acid transport system ATPase component
VVLGRNGVGKTTLLKSLMGLVPIKTGSIEFDGKPIQGATPTSAPAPASATCRRAARSSAA